MPKMALPLPHNRDDWYDRISNYSVRFLSYPPKRGQFMRKSLQTLITLSDDDLAMLDIAEMHLICAEGLPEAETLDIQRCLSQIEECAEKVRNETLDWEWQFQRRPWAFNNSRAVFQCTALSTILQ